MAEKWWLHHRRITLHAVQLGQYFYEFPAAWPFHVDLEIDELVVKPMKKKQYYTAGACLKGSYAAHQVLKIPVRIKASFRVVLGTLASL